MKSNKKVFGDYYLGLDIGTDSIGWCVTDLDYRILKFNGKRMWGIRLFDAASPAEERRFHRASRRRNDRKKQRITILQELLADEIVKIDPDFYLRMKESKFYPEDKNKKLNSRFALFADEKYTDDEYYKEFPTIYHLRHALMEGERKYDIRLYYLALSHFMKHRGHFLFSGDISQATSFDVVWSDFFEYVNEVMDNPFINSSDFGKVEKLLSDKSKTKTDKKREFSSLLIDERDSKSKELAALIIGAKVSFAKLFDDESLKDAEKNSICFSDGMEEELENTLRDILSDRFTLIEKAKAVYDWSVLTNILSGNSSISRAQVKKFQDHRQDLRDLKYIIKTFIPKEKFNILSNPDINDNYAAYASHAYRDNIPSSGNVLQENFIKFVNKKIEKIDSEDKILVRVRSRLEQGVFMPKQVSKDNGVIPYQVHLADLEKIVENMGRDYPSLAKAGEDGLSVCNKILQTFKFRIPYFVGPLNTHHSDKGGNSWAVRGEGKIYPWNFDSIVDLEASEEKFIRRMTNKCTYLKGEDVLPKSSILYSKYLVLNELNNIKVNGEKLSVDIKQEVFQRLFLNNEVGNKITLKKLKDWLEKENFCEKEDEVTGIDIDFKSNMSSYRAFRNILGDRIDSELPYVEEVINRITIFADDNCRLERYLINNYQDRYSKEEIKQIARLNFKGWGRFSKKLLSGIESASRETGELLTIIRMMWETQNNFMELMSGKHDFLEEIDKHNKSVMGECTELTYDLVKESYVSPAVKRGIWQTLLIVQEIVKITGHNPKRVFIEVAREADSEKKRTKSRKEQLLELYKSINAEASEWVEEVSKIDEQRFNSKRLYLYYMQMGRCMYTGNRIEISSLFDENVYDIDHIIPQSKKKDDSILNNMVLVERQANSKKGDTYPIPSQYRQKNLWNSLKTKNFITSEKYDRLMRRNPLSDDELAGFISRQLVETRQSTKVVAELLGQIMPETKIVYSKASAVSDFRRDKHIYKARSVNDYHHAVDAYLNIVVGNVYQTKFTDNPMRYIQKEVQGSNGKEKYSLRRMFDFDVERNGVVAWSAGEDGSLRTVYSMLFKDEEHNIPKSDILFTRYATEKRGGLFDQMPKKKGSGQLMPLKSSDQRMDVEKYGGYNKPSINYFMLVESDGKAGRIRTIEGVPVYLKNADEKTIIDFCVRKLGLNNPNVRVKEIRINSFFKANGYPIHLSGKSSNTIITKNAVQLSLSNYDMKYVRKIEKFLEKRKVNRNIEISEYDGLNVAQNIELYDKLLNKGVESIYKNRPESKGKTIVDGRDSFLLLECDKQCIVLLEVLKMFRCSSVTADLSGIEGPKNAGNCRVNKEVTKFKEFIMITQSPTGLFEKEIDLLKV